MYVWTVRDGTQTHPIAERAKALEDSTRRSHNWVEGRDR